MATPASRIHTVEDARRLARRRLPWMVFDYIDGAARDGRGEAAAREALRAIPLVPRVLEGVERRSLAVRGPWFEAELPFGIAPMGMCDLAGPGADRALARLAAERGVPIGVSTAASTPLETMAELAAGRAWFQLYFRGDEAGSMALVARAEAAGYETLVLTVDVPEVGRRPRELARGFTMPFRIGPRQFADFALHPRWSLATLAAGAPELANFGGDFGRFDRTASRAGADWALLDRIRERWRGRLVVKGVLHADDAVRLAAAGVDAVQVSSHGGRQLDAAPPPIEALARVRAALGPDFPLFYDSGIRGGEDVVRAYARGADYAFVGRPLLFGHAADGARGLARVVDVLAAETDIALAMLGRRSLDGLGAIG